jgi:hypothetical protein
VKNGVPFDVAFGLDDKDRIAWCIVMSQFHGRKFNWDRMEFEEDG